MDSRFGAKLKGVDMPQGARMDETELIMASHGMGSRR